MDNRDKQVNDNIGLVHALAKRFKGRGIEYDDLFQAGCVGLVKAIDAFDENRGFKFSTYAVPVILGEIKRLFRDGGSVKIGRALKELSLRASRECASFSAREGRTPTISELAKILEVEDTQAAQALNASKLPLSLSSDEDCGGTIEVPVESGEEQLSEKLALKQVLSELESDERALIILRFFKNYTQNKTGKMLSMTQVQVSRKEKKILERLKVKLNV
jgi:RNA polymerase sporulation-specific sigma factor